MPRVGQAGATVVETGSAAEDARPTSAAVTALAARPSTGVIAVTSGPRVSVTRRPPTRLLRAHAERATAA